MSGQTFVTRVRFPDAGRQASGESWSSAQRVRGAGGAAGSRLLAGTGIPAGSRIGAMIIAAAEVATVVPGTVSRDGTVTRMEMRADELRLEVTIEERPGSDTLLTQRSYVHSNAATCARESEFDAALLAAFARAGLDLHPDDAGAVAPATDVKPRARRAS